MPPPPSHGHSSSVFFPSDGPSTRPGRPTGPFPHRLHFHPRFPKLSHLFSSFKLKRQPKPKYAIAPKSMHKPPIIIYYGKKPPIHVYQKPDTEVETFSYNDAVPGSSSGFNSVSSSVGSGSSSSSSGAGVGPISASTPTFSYSTVETVRNRNKNNNENQNQQQGQASSPIENHVDLTFGGSQNTEVRKCTTLKKKTHFSSRVFCLFLPVPTKK